MRDDKEKMQGKEREKRGMKEKTYCFVVEDIPVTVTKKRIKHMYLRIRKEDGTVLISAPYQVSNARIRAFAKERIDWIREYRGKYMKMNEKRENRQPLTQAQIRQRKALLKAAVEQLVAKWEPVMGVKVSGITIRQMKTRWGSCNVKTHHININLALYDKGLDSLEYVVIHEMCHILEASHSPVFWEYVGKYYPDWKAVKKRLNDEIV